MEGDQIQHHREDGEEDENEIKVEHATFSHAGPVEDDTKLPPKVDSEVEVLHEKVTKQIIKEGYGPKPARAWTESTLHKFEDTWQEQHPLELVIGKGTV
ncbi:Peptidyl-prolyl cis-trans isomerase [Nymphaea thermarum]|nr:Peptidyl-prolyl cis-trans isomerase [Nymphaea thermarum]